MTNMNLQRAQAALAAALRDVADHIVKFADITGWDTSHQPSALEEAARRTEVLSVAEALAELSGAAGTRVVHRREFEALLQRLPHGPALLPDHHLAVARAFRDLQEAQPDG